MSNKYTELINQVVEKVGGKENISNVFHCMTRLRFNLVNKDLPDRDAIKKIDGVLGIQDDNSGLQVIIGPHVDKVYQELIVQTGLAETEKINENLDEKTKLGVKGIFDSIINAFSASMNPLVPVFVLIGTFNVVATLIGPSFLKLVPQESDLYTNFYNVGQAIIYFLPVLLAVTASRHFKTNLYLSLVVSFILVYPPFIDAVNTGSYTVYGLPVTAATYTSTVIPIMLAVWVQSYVEKLVEKIVPNVLNVLLVPFLVIAIMLPLELCVLGPLGTIIGGLLANFIVGLNQVAGPVETALICAIGFWLSVTGIGRPIFFICMSMLFANGVEYAYMPYAMVMSNFLSMGVSLGYAIKTRNKDKKQLGITCFISTLLGGVSEPTTFGIALPNKKTYLPMLIGGAIGGLFMGITKVGYYQFGPSNVLSVIGFISENSSNLVNGCISAALCFGVTFVLMLLTFKDAEQA